MSEEDGSRKSGLREDNEERQQEKQERGGNEEGEESPLDLSVTASPSTSPSPGHAVGLWLAPGLGYILFVAARIPRACCQQRIW